MQSGTEGVIRSLIQFSTSLLFTNQKKRKKERKLHGAQVRNKKKPCKFPADHENAQVKSALTSQIGALNKQERVLV